MEARWEALREGMPDELGPQERQRLHDRFAKRTAALAEIHEAPAYRAWASRPRELDVWRSGMVFVPNPPDPHDLGTSKRTWERALSAYRNALKDWNAHNTAVAARAAWSDWAHRLVNRLVWCPMCEQTGHALSRCPELEITELHKYHGCQYCDSFAHHELDCGHAHFAVMERRDQALAAAAAANSSSSRSWSHVQQPGSSSSLLSPD